jgi:divalent metal cation (Fe/Co/Zn/Cd) transporter
MNRETEYEHLAALEKDTARTRHTTFAGILSVSFLLPGLALRVSNRAVLTLFGEHQSLGHLVFFLGYLFYIFAIFHYEWYHRYSHRYRKALKELELELNISVYRLRVRPQIGPLKFHYDWALYIIGLLYGAITASYVGWVFFAAGVMAVVALYAICLLISYWLPAEPLER